MTSTRALRLWGALSLDRDPTCIRYAFYFRDKPEALRQDHEALRTTSGCEGLTEKAVQDAMATMEGRSGPPYVVLHDHGPVTCLLHAVTDTLIWQIAFSGGRQATDPGTVWRRAIESFRQRPAHAYGVTHLFVANVNWGSPAVAESKLYEILRGVKPDLPPHPGNGTAQGLWGRLTEAGSDSFLLVVPRGSREMKSADFQCGLFPRLEMQRHKVAYYRHLAHQSGEVVRSILNGAVTSSMKGNRVLLDGPHLRRLVEVSLYDLSLMARNIERARESYLELLGHSRVPDSDGIWERTLSAMGVAARNAWSECEDTKAKLEALPSAPLRSLDASVRRLSSQVPQEIRNELDGMLNALRSGDVVGALLRGSRIGLTILHYVFKARGNEQPNDNLNDWIEEAQKKGIIPGEIASYLHLARVFSNKPDHRAERIRLTVEDGENVLAALLRVVEWYCCEYEHGPQLECAYSE